jgi:C4-dicarboxylate-specific signal transduction histidine kinase
VNPFEFVLAIVSLVLLYKVVAAYFASRFQQRNAQEREHTEADVYLERLRQLEERIRVLERIVTDEQLDLKRQFRNL